MGQYLPVLVMLVLGAGFAGSSLVMSKAVSPKRPSAAKAAPYECGIVPGQQPPERFPVRFYLVAMIFLLFDIEVAFLYPWAMALRDLRWVGFAQVLVFFAILLAGFFYIWRKGGLEVRTGAADPGPTTP